ncbi:MAG TPA: cytochrome P450 [Sporichthyaceae bacterium]|nr:cytochrome P450 [Sporichthyaceae bacterium]
MSTEMISKYETMSTLKWWSQPRQVHWDHWKWLRENDPVSWHGPPEALDPELDNSQGYWSLVRHADIRHVSRNPELFSSAEGVFVDDFPQLESMLSFIVTDAPRHPQMRNIVSVAFTPRNMKKMEDEIDRLVIEVVDEIVGLGQGDLSQLLTKEVPGRAFAANFGVTDPALRKQIMDLAEQLGAWNDPEYAHIGSPLIVFADASYRLGEIAIALAKERRDNPTDDLMSWVSQASYEGQKMTVEEVGVFFALLAGASNDTTRHAMGHVLALFQQHPDQLAWLFEDFDGRIDGAINELLRYETPIMHFRRTATRDTEINGTPVQKGDKVVLWYVAGNRDPAVFPEPESFDIRNPASEQMSFGGGGPHYCIGHLLGRRLLRTQIQQVYTRMHDLQVGERHILLSNFMNGVMRLPATWTPA